MNVMVFVLLLFSHLLVLMHPAQAGSFNVSPIKVELSPSGRAEVVRIRNIEEQPVLVQIQAKEWSGNVDEANHARDLVAVPAVVEIPAHSEQVIRVALRQSLQGRTEASYRLLIAEVPRPRNDPTNGLAFALRLVLPVFATPQGAEPLALWNVKPDKERGATLILSNGGEAHIHLRKLAFAGRILSERATYVLAGESKSWPLDISLSELPEVVEVRAETNHGPMVVQVRPGAGG